MIAATTTFGFQIMRGFYQRTLERAPFARLQLCQAVRSDGHPYQAQSGKANRGGHAPHLAIAAFHKYQFDPTGWNVSSKSYRRIARPELGFGDALRLRGPGAFAFQQNSATQLFKCLLGGFTLDLRPVGLGQLVAWIAQFMLQVSVVGEQQQSFAVAVEPARGIDARRLDVVGEGRATFLVGELGQHPVGLVEQNQHSNNSVSSCA
jgi:hypothetical protein